MANEETGGNFQTESDEIAPHKALNREDDSLQTDSSLEALVNQEQTLAARQLHEELGREPTQEEIDEWLKAHTESY